MTYSEKIKQMRFNLQMNMRDFGEKVGLDFSTISLLEKGYRGKNKKPIIPLIDTLKQICDRCQYPFKTFLEEAGYIDPSPILHTMQTPAIIPLWEESNIRQKRELLKLACTQLGKMTEFEEMSKELVTK